MDNIQKQDTTTGSGTTPTPILASAGDPMADHSKHAPTKKESPSINPADVLSLLQSDCSDLQSLGLKVILAGTDKGDLHILIRWEGKKLSFSDDSGHILVDGKHVTA